MEKKVVGRMQRRGVRPRGCPMGIRIWGLILVAGLLLPGVTPAATISWIHPDDGTSLAFSDGDRWQGGTAPGPGDLARFNLGLGVVQPSGPVSLTDDAEIGALGVISGQVEIDLSGHDLTATSTGGALQVFPDFDGAEPQLTLSNSSAGTPAVFRAREETGPAEPAFRDVELQGGGILNVVGSDTGLEAARIAVGVESPLAESHTTGSPSQLHVDGASLSLVSRLDVGASEDGVLLVEGGGQIQQIPSPTSGETGLGFFLGDGADATGTAVLRGAATRADVDGIVVGGRGSGELSLEDGAAVTAQESVFVGALSGGAGSLSITGDGTSLETAVLQVGSKASTGSLTVEDGSVSVGSLIADFGANTALDLRGGQVTVTRSLFVDTDSADPLVLGGQLDLDLGSSGRAFLRDGVELAPGSQLNLNGGRLTTPEIVDTGGEFHWNAGSLRLSGSSLRVDQGGLVGAEVDLQGGLANRNELDVAGTLTIDGAQTMDPQAPGGRVALGSGGALRAGAIVLENDGALDWTGGHLSLAASDLTLEADGLVGDQLVLDADRRLSVSGATTLADGASLTLNGGQLSTGSLVGSGFIWNGGALGIDTLAVGSGEGQLGQLLEVGADRSLDAGQLAIGDGRVVVKGGKVSARVLSVDSGEGGRLDFESGSLEVSNDDLTVGTGGITGAGGSPSVELTSGDLLRVDGALTVEPGSFLEVVGGSLDVGAASRVFFSAGSVRARSDLTVGSGGLLGANAATSVTVGAASDLRVDGVLSVDAGHTLAVAGGEVLFDALAGGIHFGSGRVVSDGSLFIGSGGLLGSEGATRVDLLESGDSLSVTNHTTVMADHELVVDGGTFATGTLAVDAGGSFALESGLFVLNDQDLYIGSSFANPAGFKLESNAGGGEEPFYTIKPGASIFVGTGHTTFVDASRLEIQQGGSLSTWELEAPEYVTGEGLLRVRRVVVDQNTLFDSTIVGELVDVGAALTLGSNAALFANAAIASGGSLVMQAGSTMTGEASIAEGGTLSGVGSIEGGITNGGLLAPGQSPGELDVDGFFTQLSEGTLSIELGRDATTQQVLHDALSVSGTVSLDGTLEIATDTTSAGIAPDFDPADLGTFAFTFLTGDLIVGTFDAIVGASVGNGLQWVVEYFRDRVALSLQSDTTAGVIDHRTLGVSATVPEPTPLSLLLATGLAAALWRRRPARFSGESRP